mgnify:CR=1 FL=1
MVDQTGFQLIVSRIYGEKKFGIGDMHEMISDNDKSLYFRVILFGEFLDSLKIIFVLFKCELLIFVC